MTDTMFGDNVFDDIFANGVFNQVGAGDITKPTISLSNSAAGSLNTFTATASDNVAVVGVQFFVNGLPAGAEVSAAPFAFVWSTSGQLDGAYNITAQARDAAGNSQLSNTVQVVVSNGIDIQGAPTVRGGRSTWRYANGAWQQIGII